MNFSERDGNVRVDLFKKSGTWYTTESIDMTQFYLADNPETALIKAMELKPDGVFAKAKSWLESGGVIVCLIPYHKHSCPVMLRGRNGSKIYSEL